MKRILFTIAVLILLAACSVEQQTTVTVPSEPAAPSEPSSPAAAPAPSDEPPVRVDQMPDVPEKKTEYASHQSPDLVKAFETGMQKCSYLLDGVMYTAWIFEEDRFRFEKAVPGQRVSAIYDKQIVYSWDDRTKQGVRVNINDLSDQDEDRIAGIDIPLTPEEIKSDQAERVICVPSTAIGETVLEVPGNVDFIDLGDLLAEEPAEE